MRVEVQFVSFPKSSLFKSIVEQKIKECVSKFSTNTAQVKAFFTIDGFEHHVKIAVTSGKMSICVNSSSSDIGYTIDKVLDKLESSLRKASKRMRHKRNELPTVNNKSDYSATNLRTQKRHHNNIDENVFDKYELQYVSDFEDQIRKVS